MATDEWGGVRLHCGDALAVLPTLSGIDAVITDPPYGIGLESHAVDVCMDGSSRRRRRTWEIHNDADTTVGDRVILWADWHALPLVVFGSPYRPYFGEWRNVLVWDKGPAVGGGGDPATCWKRTFELIYTRRNLPLAEGRDEAVLPFHTDNKSGMEFHPCQKPVPLLRYLIRQLTRPGDLIIDPFMGSGSTGVAAVMEGRRFVGVELDPTHYATALKRLRAADGAGSLFENAPRQLTIGDGT